MLFARVQVAHWQAEVKEFTSVNEEVPSATSITNIMVWSQQVLRQFKLVPPNADGNAYLGPWNKLLYTLFSSSENDFIVVPNFQESSSSDGLYLSFSMDVYLDDNHVLLIDLNKKPSNLRYVSKREEVDIQGLIRYLRRFSYPNFYGISAFGTKVCFYKLGTARRSVIGPPLISRDLEGTTNGISGNQWNDDVLGADGEDKLRGVLEGILEAIKGL
ncbi:hypothetical protein M407DRAFT_18183 [Tulasnella calospora MUT 4182]|uniref:Uncharacterized protein n=1 Tax=Tulasnella calospora MUT 4182 TaxID=1051891 RepID=A0A0C3MH41_9AGAM|nr:hypothetical protein M407DRAFT_18183 [Tulasnella calospora MUT 4182]